jgi:hypothetical protein
MLRKNILLQISRGNSGGNKTDDFKYFLTYHRKVISFQENNNLFQINLNLKTPEEYSAFIDGIKEIYSIKLINGTDLCQAKCRDGSNCLNKTKTGNYCSKHRLTG